MQGSDGVIVAIIPARWASSRFPGKPLVDLLGTPMIVRVADRLARSKLATRVAIATDDERIRDRVKAAGFEVVMTPEGCASGTDRVAAAVEILGLGGAALVVNVQGDEPLIDPSDIDALISATLSSGCEMGTLARPLHDRERFLDPNVVKVVRGEDGRAIYFSRAPIAPEVALQHIGLYAYKPDALHELVRVGPSALEKSERLEQLRALEHGLAIHVALAKSASPSIAIDTPEDVARVLAVLTASNGTRSAHAPR
jgi:3-deoxy-manno-octulosonate cytidylyltransferase (CMP-KDO synthetase)